jgi:hypothetical protein
MLRKFATIACLVAVAAALTPAATASAKTKVLLRSCVDIGNDGLCHPTDPDLAPLVADGTFNSTVTEPGWTGRTAEVGAVVADFTITKASGGLDLTVTGDVRFESKVSSEGSDAMHLHVHARDVRFVDKANVTGKCDFAITATRLVRVGKSARVYAPGKGCEGLRISAPTIDLQDKAELSAPGMYSGMDIEGGTITFGTEVKTTTAPRGTTMLTSHSNINAFGLLMQGGYIYITAVGQARTITLNQPSIRGSYDNGIINVTAGDGNAAHGNAIHLAGKRGKPANIVAKGGPGDVFFAPAPS